MKSALFFGAHKDRVAVDAFVETFLRHVIF